MTNQQEDVRLPDHIHEIEDLALKNQDEELVEVNPNSALYLVRQLRRSLRDLRAANERAEKAEAALEGKWISVGERLPDYGVKVLVYAKYDWGPQIVTRHCGMGGDEWNRVFDGVPASYITHWQPLPEPPKQEGQ